MPMTYRRRLASKPRPKKRSHRRVVPAPKKSNKRLARMGVKQAKKAQKRRVPKHRRISADALAELRARKRTREWVNTQNALRMA